LPEKNTDTGHWLSQCTQPGVPGKESLQRLANFRTTTRKSRSDGKPRPEPGLFDKNEEPPLWAKVNLNRVSVERLRYFGDIYLALLLWSKLGFAAFCKERLLAGREEIPWAVMVCILVIARFCAPSSELQIADSWYGKTALDDLLGVPFDKFAYSADFAM
jgi:hypothetical protein